MTNAELAEVFRGARELLSDPARWTQNGNAYDADGHRLDNGSNPAAVEFCLVGACQRAGIGEFDDEFDAALTACMTDRNGNPWPGMAWEWNDHPRTRHQDVLAALDCAIVRLSSAPREER